MVVEGRFARTNTLTHQDTHTHTRTHSHTNKDTHTNILRNQHSNINTPRDKHKTIKFSMKDQADGSLFSFSHSTRARIMRLFQMSSQIWDDVKGLRAMIDGLWRVWLTRI